MGYRTGLEIKLSILDQLSERPYVLNELERKIDTNGQVLRRHLDELVQLGLIRLKQHSNHACNGQRYTTAELLPKLPQQSYEGILRQNQSLEDELDQVQHQDQSRSRTAK
ncbi:MAG: hypothetical protein ACE37H_12025 [Phycisphaeraceae bacterium]